MNTLSYTPYAVHEHLEMFEVEFRHADLPLSFARLMVPMCKGPDGRCLDGPALDEQILSHAPPRAWFEGQEARLAGATTAIQSIPAAFRSMAPVLPLVRPQEWYEDVNVDEPELIDGRWQRRATFVDLRLGENNLDVLKERLSVKLSAVRYQHETGGIMFNGAPIKTDRESQSTIGNAKMQASTDPKATVEWKADNGFVTLDAVAIMALGTAVFNHVQRCFARENFIKTQIAASENVVTLLAVAEMLDEGWGE